MLTRIKVALSATTLVALCAGGTIAIDNAGGASVSDPTAISGSQARHGQRHGDWQGWKPSGIDTAAASPSPTAAPTSANDSAPASDTAATSDTPSARSAASPSTPALSPATTTTPSSSTEASTDSSSMPVGDVTSNGRTWHQSYAQDFDTPAALGSFSKAYPNIGLYDGYNDTSGKGYYDPAKVLSVSNGNLDFWLHSENGQPLSATILPDNWAPHVTGRVSIRYKTTNTDGYKFVGMLWPSDNNWNEGEIDWPEANLGSTPRPASAIPGTASNGSPTFVPDEEQFAASDTTGYHTATTEWDRNEVRFYWDGTLVASTTQAVPDTAMRVTLQAETWISDEPVPTDASGHVDVDWVSIWD